MSRNLVIRRLAELDAADASDWYNQQQPGLGAEFIDQLDAELHLIVEAPERWPVYHRNMRRYLMRRFPFGIYYEFDEHVVRVAAIMHGARDPAFILRALDRG